MGLYSDVNTVGATIESEPDAPTNPPVATSYSESEATIEMSSTMRLLSTSSPILYYELLWDSGTNGASWSSYTVTSNNIVTVTGLSSGVTYQFKYRTQNIHGWGDYSPILTLTATDLPQQVNTVLTTNEGADVKIYWDIPFSGGLNVPIIAYDILI